jgi:O-antigen/teichoic acid export membrane protein
MRRILLSSGAAVGAARLTGIGMGLLVTVVIARQTGPAGLGAFGYAVMLLALIASPISNGWATLVLRTVAGAVHDGNWGPAKGMILRGTQLASAVTLLVWLAALAVTLAFTQQLPPAWRWVSVGTVSALAFVLFFDQLAALRMSVLRGLDRPVWGQLPEVLVRPGLIVLSITMIGLTLNHSPGVQHAFIALMVGAGVSALAGAAVLWKKAPTDLTHTAPEFRTRQWLGVAASLAGNSGLILLNTYVDVLLLGALSSLEQVGIYRVAMQVSLFSGFVYTALNLLASQRFAHLRAKGEPKALQHTAVYMARIAAAGSLPLPVLFAFFGEPLVGFAFGAAFIPALAPMFVLFLNQSLNASVGMTRTLLVMCGKEGPLIPFTLASIALNVVLGVLLVPRFGAVGAAASTTIATVAWNLLLWRYARRETGIDPSVLGLPLRAGREITP